MTEPRSRFRDGTHPDTAFARARGSGMAWLRRTFAGLTWQWIAVYGLVLFGIALTKGPRFVLIAGGDLRAMADAIGISMLLVATKYVPILLVVVAAVNHGPKRGQAQIRWLVASIFVAQFVGIAMLALVLPYAAPKGVLARYVDLDAPVAVQMLRWTSLALTEVGIAGSAAACWFFLQRRAKAVAALHSAQHDSERAQRESVEARLTVMQAQIEPHFLFNTLASIRRLYETDRSSGRAMLRHLASYLTASLPTLRATHSTLGRELALAVAYLNVQKIRMGARLAVEIDVPAALHDVVVPPMMLATLVENAIIHGIAPLPEGGIVRIVAHADGQRMRIEVKDTGRGLQEVWGAGVGLANIRARLRTEFGETAGLQLTDGPQHGVTATIELPLPAMTQALAA